MKQAGSALLGLAFVLALLCVVAPTPDLRADEIKPALAVTAIRVQLFQNKTGTLSDNIVGKDSAALHNRFAGDNAADTGLVVIQVSGPPRGVLNGFFGKKQLLHVRLRTETSGRGGPSRTEQTRVLPVFGETGQVYLAFWLAPLSCAPIGLTASIPELPKAKSIETHLDFSCGE